jgi:hypothetical protein
MDKPNKARVNPVRRVENLILSLRGQKVLLDADLAAIYGVPTKALNQAVKRNADRFPEDFCFQLSADEWAELNRSQIVTGSQKHRDPRFLPRAFTEHGALMAYALKLAASCSFVAAVPQRLGVSCSNGIPIRRPKVVANCDHLSRTNF